MIEKCLRACSRSLLSTPFHSIFAAIPSDLLDVDTATPRQVFQVFHCQTRGVFRRSEIASRLENIVKCLWKKDREQALR